MRLKHECRIPNVVRHWPFGVCRSKLRAWLALPALAAALAGCAAHHPLEGIPVSQVPPEWRHPITYRSGRETIDLSLLRQTPPAEHRVDSGDVLGIYIEGILGGDGQLPPVYTPQSADLPPSIGYPVAVRGDGTISLPGYDAINVRGLTLRQVESRIRAACSGGDQPLLVRGNEQIIVSLQRPRVARVLVIRQEAGNEAGHGPQHGENSTNRQKRGTGRVVALPAYRNDVLHALAETGGLPGLDAENVIYVIRGSRNVPPPVAPPPAPPERNVQRARNSVRGEIQLAGSLVSDPFLQGSNEPGQDVSAFAAPGADAPASALPGPEAGLPSAGHSTVDERFHTALPVPAGERSLPSVTEHGPSAWPDFCTDFGWTGIEIFDAPTMMGPRAVCIPLKLLPGELPQFGEPDIILHDGDVVFVETRERDFFLTGGLLGGGQYPLPRDYDITVIDAIAIAEQSGANSPLPTRALGGVSALNQDVTVGASKVILLRKLPDGCEVPIEIDLYEAIRHPQQRMIVQSGDRIILQYTRLEAIGAFIERHILDGAIIGLSSAAVFSN